MTITPPVIGIQDESQQSMRQRRCRGVGGAGAVGRTRSAADRGTEWIPSTGTGSRRRRPGSGGQRRPSWCGGLPGDPAGHHPRRPPWEWLCADAGGGRTTVAGYRSVVGFLAKDRVGDRRADEPHPEGARRPPAPTGDRRGGRTRRCGREYGVLRSALRAGYAERILDVHPLDSECAAHRTPAARHARTGGTRAGDPGCAKQRAIDAAIREGQRRGRLLGRASGRADAAAHPAGRWITPAPAGCRRLADPAHPTTWTVMC